MLAIKVTAMTPIKLPTNLAPILARLNDRSGYPMIATVIIAQYGLSKPRYEDTYQANKIANVNFIANIQFEFIY
ncbi:hypothetical protein PROVRUST_07664 [Providencia rustigianii DSM 4541]|uniref:Uncharacterized protein n=1 Tax=Providencia rustigianii DSM 4541 TaxID=500637 RepID=D1P600_9GAMM|nr:hypothetical protein PROVRUST_07664 [Providencia rustigianii DSM 4541]